MNVNDKAAYFYRKAVISLSRWIQKIDLWSRRFPWISAFVLALTGLMLIWLVNREAR